MEPYSIRYNDNLKGWQIMYKDMFAMTSEFFLNNSSPEFKTEVKKLIKFSQNRKRNDYLLFLNQRDAINFVEYVDSIRVAYKMMNKKY
ncbi:MAG: hypothetical protein WCJ62_13450 [Flavobacterium sp.]